MACFNDRLVTIQEVIAYLQLDPTFRQEFAEKYNYNNLRGVLEEPPIAPLVSNVTCSQCGEYLSLCYENALEHHIAHCHGKVRFPSLLDAGAPERAPILEELKRWAAVKQGKAFVVSINRNALAGLVAIMNIHRLDAREARWDAFVINRISENIEIPHRSFYKNTISICLAAGFERKDFVVVLDGIILRSPQALECGAVMGGLELMRAFANLVFRHNIEMRPPFSCSSTLIKELIKDTDVEEILLILFSNPPASGHKVMASQRTAYRNPFTKTLLEKIIALNSPREYAFLKLLCVTFNEFKFDGGPTNFQKFQEHLKYVRAFLNPWYWNSDRDQVAKRLQLVTENWLAASVCNITLCGYSVSSNYGLAQVIQRSRFSTVPTRGSWILPANSFICGCGATMRLHLTEATRQTLMGNVTSVVPPVFSKSSFYNPPDNLDAYTPEVENALIDEILQYCSTVLNTQSPLMLDVWEKKKAGNELLRTTDYKGAIEIYEAGLAVDKGNILLLLNLATAHYLDGDVQKSLFFCGRGIERTLEDRDDRLFVTASTLKSLVLIKTERFTEAYSVLCTARQKKSIAAVAARLEELIGSVCERLGKGEEALFHYEESSALVRSTRIEAKVSAVQAAIIDNLQE